MWRILVAELNYNWMKIISVHLFCAACFITIWIGVKFESNVAPLTMLIMVVPAITICLDSEAKRSKENRFVFLISKPLRPQNIDLARLSMPIVLWITVVLLYLIMYQFYKLLSQDARSSLALSQIVFLNGMILIVMSLYYVNKDLRTFFTAKTAKFFIITFWITAYIAILSPPFILSNFLGLFGQNSSIQEVLLNVSASTNALVISNLIGFILSMISIIVFKHRRSYTK